MHIVIVDDDDIVLMSLKTIIEAKGITVSGTGKSGQEAVMLYDKYLPDILLSDIRMEQMTGIEAAFSIRKKHPNAKILFLTTFSDDEYVTEAIKCGAKGYILKQDFEGIVPSLIAVESGQSVFGGEIIEKLPQISIDKSEITTEEKEAYIKYDVTKKEYEIITLVADGLSNKEIASILFLSEGTVRNYLSNILSKLDLRDRTQLVVYYYRHKK
jgi:DNA-binding NarL/FixJ family response regulator